MVVKGTLRHALAALSGSVAGALIGVGLPMMGVESQALGVVLLVAAATLFVASIWLLFPIQTFWPKRSQLVLPNGTPARRRMNKDWLVGTALLAFVVGLGIVAEREPSFDTAFSLAVTAIVVLWLVSWPIVAVRNLRFWIRRRLRRPYH